MKKKMVVQDASKDIEDLKQEEEDSQMKLVQNRTIKSPVQPSNRQNQLPTKKQV